MIDETNRVGRHDSVQQISVMDAFMMYSSPEMEGSPPVPRIKKSEG